VVDSVEDQRVCLENVLFLNPDNENARRGLALLDSQASDAPAVGGSSAAAPAPDPEPDAFDYAPTASSSSSASYNPANELSTDEYDDWIANMGIGDDGGGNIPGDFTQSEDLTSGPFTSSNDEFDDVFAGAFDNDNFDDIGGSSSADDRLFGGGDAPAVDDLFAPEPTGTLDASADDFNADNLFDSDDDPFAGDGDFAGPFAASTPAPVDEVAPPVPARQSKKKKSRKRGSSGGAFVDSGSSKADDMDPAYYFRAIPKDIKTTQLPGLRSGTSPLTYVLLVLLIAANIGAAAMLAVG